MHALLLFLLLAPGAPPAAAQPAVVKSATQEADPAAVAEALRMLEANQFEKDLLDSTDLMVEGMFAVQIEQLQKKSEEPVPDDLIAAVRQTLRDHARGTMIRRMPEIKRQAADIYAREFTAEELRRLREIAADPVMAKQRAKGQTLNAQLMLVGVTVMRDSEAELEQKLEETLQDYLKKAGLAEDDKS
jgi:hypothetical protein